MAHLDWKCVVFVIVVECLLHDGSIALTELSFFEVSLVQLFIYTHQMNLEQRSV